METFNKLLFEYPELMYSGVGATAVIAGGALIYKIATRSVMFRFWSTALISNFS